MGDLQIPEFMFKTLFRASDFFIFFLGGAGVHELILPVWSSLKDHQIILT